MKHYAKTAIVLALLATMALSSCTESKTNDTSEGSDTVYVTDAQTEPVVSDITLTAPADGQKDITFVSDDIVKHMNTRVANVKTGTGMNYSDKDTEACTPTALTFAWEDAKAKAGKEYTLTISENEDLSNAWVYKTQSTMYDVCNFKVGTKYYWTVSSDDTVSAVSTFETKAGLPRFIRADNISNFRDIGGYKTVDGKTIKQGLAYRSAQLDDADASGKDVVLNQLGIKTDLDLRGKSGAPIAGLRYIPVKMGWYQHIFSDEYRTETRNNIRVFADEDNYPVLFHCSLGRDRTGTTAFLLLGLCGVEEEVLIKEYFLSLYSRQGNFDNAPISALAANIDALLNGLDDFGGEDATLQNKIEAYLLDIGVTQEDIDSIKRILIEE